MRCCGKSLLVDAIAMCFVSFVQAQDNKKPNLLKVGGEK